MLTKKQLEELIRQNIMLDNAHLINESTTIREYIDMGFTMQFLEEIGVVFSSYYSPSDSREFQDVDGNYYNWAGNMLRCPTEYNRYSEGYSPFGDE